MSPLRILILALFFIAVSGQDGESLAPTPEEDEAQSPMQMQSLETTIESPSVPIPSSPSESPSESPAFSPTEGPASSGEESEAPGPDDDEAYAPSPLGDYHDEEDDETY